MRDILAAIGEMFGLILMVIGLLVIFLRLWGVDIESIWAARLAITGLVFVVSASAFDHRT